MTKDNSMRFSSWRTSKSGLLPGWRKFLPKGKEISLADVAGLGKVSVKKLTAGKITTVDSFSKASTQRISEILNISGKRAQALKESAKSLLK